MRFNFSAKMKSGALSIIQSGQHLFSHRLSNAVNVQAIIQNPSLAQRNPALSAYLQQELIFETDIENKDRILL